jgi:hypothetical protein
MTAWHEALGKSGFSVGKVIPFFHPDDAPIRAWPAYRSSFSVRAATRVEKKVGKWPPFNLVRKATAQAALLWSPYRDPSWSTINVIVGTRLNT